MKDWSAGQYLKFENERSRPAQDLINQIKSDHLEHIVDIGCGPGNSTEVLLDRWPKASILGFDTSPDMIEKARQRLPEVDFQLGDVATYQPQPQADLLFSNAVFQWVPDHIAQMQRLFRSLKSGALLAIQMPDNLREATHQSMIKVAQDPRWQSRIGNKAREVLPPVSQYYEALCSDAVHVDIWHTIYNHPLDGIEAVVEWVKGTGLRPFIDPLSDEERADYLAQYADELNRHYNVASDGKVLLAFPRIFILAQKK
ncbi:trans-aconitate 2-methyltransferase [Paenochrobactrum sp. BZR 588]|uniref:trans-aconitate 2-methyltransferase n=1 Tax=unclassified Paenochrobactrum TaxID=2639760 RepID=UPI003852F205